MGVRLILTWCFISGLYICATGKRLYCLWKNGKTKWMLCNVAMFSSESSNYLLPRKCKEDSWSVCSRGSGCGQLQGWQCSPWQYDQYKKVKVHPLLFTCYTHAAEIEHNGEIAMCFFGFVDFLLLSHIKLCKWDKGLIAFSWLPLLVFKVSAIWHKTDDVLLKTDDGS